MFRIEFFLNGVRQPQSALDLPYAPMKMTFIDRIQLKEEETGNQKFVAEKLLMVGGNDFKFHVYSFTALFKAKNDKKVQVEQIRVQDVTKSLFSKLELYVFNSPVRTIFYGKNFLVIGSEMGQIRVYKL